MDLATALDSAPVHGRVDISCFIDTHSTMLYRFCRKLTYSKEDAEDLFQETWFSALRHPGKLHAAENLQRFLCRTALYLWKSKQRKHARRNRIAPEIPMEPAMDSGQSLEADYLRRAEGELVGSLVGELPDRLRIPLILYYTLEMDIAEIADTLDLPPGTVKSRLYAARQEVKKGLLKHA